MRERDWYFLVSFIISIVALSYFLAGTMTGRVVQSMYCTDEGCFEFCISHDDCYPDELCCERLGKGVCMRECQKEFLFSPELEGLPPNVEQPQQTNTSFYLGLLIVTLVIAFLYAYNRWKER
jgi:hypothetical protein